MISPISNGSMLAEMGVMKVGASNALTQSDAPKGDFGELFTRAINQVNNDQSQASDITRRFISGEAGLSTADVMRANHKSEISMEATKQVRNKLLEHYKEILNTQL
ncbi:flagellar hook-basal body complex protein FliE [Vibrio coralliirubri]|uniref:flagellar hook-basal body complex protein FliE n=1 Tax=Vibrio coralliirubri TaxID=1516159 RepID=UPI0022844165|nr:flagellar hook-basal body complex protein FliE [Vibrio coralliirubri]MCY9860985.1 flagellar hook-basal body complex protein FliE [Vibrio coralliirubri]